MFDLAEPERYRLSDAPLVQALVQVRFPLIAHLESLAGVAGLQDRLRSQFPYMEQEKVQEFSFQVGPSGPATDTASSVTWKFTDDAGHLLVVGAGSASLTAGEMYRGIDEFRECFEFVLEALSDVEDIGRIERLGVRYLSVAEGPLSDDLGSARWFRPELTGWLGAGALSPSTSVNQSLALAQISAEPVDEFADFPADVNAVVRHGFIAANTTLPGVPPVEVRSPSFLLDLDLFVAAQQRFDCELLSQQFGALHSQIDRFFLWSLSDEGKTHFGYEVLP